MDVGIGCGACREAVRTTKAATKQAPTSKAATAKATTSTTQVLVPPVPVAKASGWSPALLGGGAAGLLLVAGVLRMLVSCEGAW